MRKLKCSGCGGTLALANTPDGHVIGKCRQCGSEYVVDAKGRQHVTVEHRFPDAARRAEAAPVHGRRLLIGAALGGAAVLAGASFLGGAFSTPSRRNAAPPPFHAIFNTGGEGAGPGQFRDDPVAVAVDSLDRALVRDGDRRYYAFGPDGRFLNHYARPFHEYASFTALLPGGDLILDHRDQFARVDMESGTVKEVTPAPGLVNEWRHGAANCVTPDGGIALYRVPDAANEGRPSMGMGTSAPGSDVVIFLDRTLRETHRLTDLLPQAIAPDPMITKAPEPVSIAVDGNGSIFILVIPKEDHDNRTGIFEFNAAGRFQRRIALEQKYYGSLAIAPDGSLWVQDVWMSEIQHVTPAGVTKYETAGLGRTRDDAPGNIRSLAVYRDGSLAMIGNQRLIRAELTATRS